MPLTNHPQPALAPCPAGSRIPHCLQTSELQRIVLTYRQGKLKLERPDHCPVFLSDKFQALGGALCQPAGITATWAPLGGLTCRVGRAGVSQSRAGQVQSGQSTGPSPEKSETPCA